MKHINYKRVAKIPNRSFLPKRFLWPILFVIIFLQVFFAVQSLGVGGLLPNLEKESKEILIENKRLQRELVAKTSLSDLEKKAPELGFINQKMPLYIRPDDVFAQALR